VNLQVVSDRWGRLVHAGDPLPGATHDAAAFVETGLERLLGSCSARLTWEVVGCLGTCLVTLAW